MTKEHKEDRPLDRCVVCGCILPKYHVGSKICECCQDDLEDNPYKKRSEDMIHD